MGISGPTPDARQPSPSLRKAVIFPAALRPPKGTSQTDRRVFTLAFMLSTVGRSKSSRPSPPLTQSPYSTAAMYPFRLVRVCHLHSLAAFIRWPFSFAGCVHSLAAFIRWLCSFAGCVHSLAAFIRWLRSFAGGFVTKLLERLAEAKPMAPHHAQTKPLVCMITLPASTQCEAGSMSALSLTSNVRGRRFQMHHYGGCAGDPLKNWRFEPLSLAYFSLRRQREVGAAPHRGER
jgi:hypothetical protein